MSDLLFDTCFLIDLERELRRGAGVAHAFTAAHRGDRFWISWTVAGEFAEGFGDIDDPACATMLSRFGIVAFDKAVAGNYARIASELRRQKQLIGTNDLWIAAAALAADTPLVTNNVAHFSRIAGLKVMTY